ncbi:unnamed protein product [Ilex paraguariensis]|uniref:RING-type domain-containing protein n=1 Tax=Ilex paraguariensis TaxID=185542 RepID=A0ABC8RH92_9AQUA
MLVVVVMVVALVLKFLGSLRGDTTIEQVIATETDRLLPKEATSFSYGTSEEDEESGNCNNSSSEDLYDGKICVICYDEPRDCFFIPCGHCATCYVCAQRIMDGERKACPVCRKFINKVRKLFIA